MALNLTLEPCMANCLLDCNSGYLAKDATLSSHSFVTAFFLSIASCGIPEEPAQKVQMPSQGEAAKWIARLNSHDRRSVRTPT